MEKADLFLSTLQKVPRQKKDLSYRGFSEEFQGYPQMLPNRCRRRSDIVLIYEYIDKTASEARGRSTVFSSVCSQSSVKCVLYEGSPRLAGLPRGNLDSRAVGTRSGLATIELKPSKFLRSFIQSSVRSAAG